MSTHLQNSEKHVRTFLLSSVWLREVIKVANAFAVLARRGTNKGRRVGGRPNDGVRARHPRIERSHLLACQRNCVARNCAFLRKSYQNF
jgi:hypothetical protein